MKGFSIQNIALGIGIGMILTASVNIFSSIGWMESNGGKHTDTSQFITLPKEEGHNEVIIEEDEAYFMVHIEKGMNSGDIALLLQEKGIINDSNDFLLAAAEMDATYKMRFGEKKIPIDSSLQDLIEILIEIDL